MLPGIGRNTGQWAARCCSCVSASSGQTLGQPDARAARREAVAHRGNSSTLCCGCREGLRVFSGTQEGCGDGPALVSFRHRSFRLPRTQHTPSSPSPGGIGVDVLVGERRDRIVVRRFVLAALAHGCRLVEIITRIRRLSTRSLSTSRSRRPAASALRCVAVTAPYN
ncbi:hypothetical protein Franean1_3179 [Parafrankia sp. EAN1pec]|nr:hypothetical protein Franean1_3179 [Frankia sp. EAN1pec]